MGLYQELVGQKAPSFTLPNYDGKDYEVKPGELGVPLVIFFYPKSGSAGCTMQACQLRDAVAQKPSWKNVQLVGISPDSVEKQAKFVQKNKLTYPVLSDEKGTVREAYKVGKGLLGLADAARITFLVDKDGTVKDALEATLNYGAHKTFVDKWLTKLAEESGETKGSETAAAVPASTTDTAETPKPAETT